MKKNFIRFSVTILFIIYLGKGFFLEVFKFKLQLLLHLKGTFLFKIWNVQQNTNIFNFNYYNLKVKKQKELNLNAYFNLIGKRKSLRNISVIHLERWHFPYYQKTISKLDKELPMFGLNLKIFYNGCLMHFIKCFFIGLDIKKLFHSRWGKVAFLFRGLDHAGVVSISHLKVEYLRV